MKGLNMKKSENKRQPIQARKRAFAFLNNKSGEGYVDVAVTVMIVAFVLVFSVNVVSLVALNQNIKTAADQLTDYAAMKGTVSVDEYARELKEKIGVDFSYSFDGSETLDSTGKVAAWRPDHLYRHLSASDARLRGFYSPHQPQGVVKRTVAGLLEMR